MPTWKYDHLVQNLICSIIWPLNVFQCSHTSWSVFLIECEMTSKDNTHSRHEISNFCRQQHFSVNGHHISPTGVDVTTLNTVNADKTFLFGRTSFQQKTFMTFDLLKITYCTPLIKLPRTLCFYMFDRCSTATQHKWSLWAGLLVRITDSGGWRMANENRSVIINLINYFTARYVPST